MSEYERGFSDALRKASLLVSEINTPVNCNAAVNDSLTTELEGLQLYNACMSYRHDFGLLSPEERTGVVRQAKEWFKFFSCDFDMTLKNKKS